MAGRVHVVWEAKSFVVAEDDEEAGPGSSPLSLPPIQHKVMYQQKYGSSWVQPADEFRSSNTNVNYYRPTVSHLSNGKIVWAWDDGSSTYKAVHNGSSWTVTEVNNAITQPSLAINGAFGSLNNTRFVATGTTGTPYPLVISAATSRAMDDPLNEFVDDVEESYEPTSVVSLQSSRRAVVAQNPAGEEPSPTADSSSFFSVELLSVTLKLRDSTVIPLEFTAVREDSLDERSLWGALATMPVTLTSTIDSIIVDGIAEAFAPQRLSDLEIGLSFEILDADLGLPLQKIGIERVFRNSNRKLLNVRGRIASLVGRKIIMRPNVRGLIGRSGELVSTVVHVHTVLDDTASNLTGPVAQTSALQSIVPTIFDLAQNYPNPFNPSTVIRYQIPEGSYVSLKVYDVLGREVATLVEDTKDAGYHETILDASMLGSGVYFYRMQAGSYNAVRKLPVVK